MGVCSYSVRVGVGSFSDRVNVGSYSDLHVVIFIVNSELYVVTA